MKGWLRLAGAVALCLLLSGIAPVSAHVAAPTSPTHARSTPRAAVVTNGQWSVYHRDNAHTGFDPTQSTASGATTGWVSGTFDAQVYASPLVYQGVVYVATLNNTVYALNQADGSTLWLKNLGAPTSGGWICGNVSPQGILGTPVIDAAANRIYVAAFMSSHVWTIFGLDLANSGNIVLQTTIPGNFAGGFFDWKIQQERGALGLANGYVYVPFGGRLGDCNDGSILYQAWVIGIPTSGSTTLPFWNNGGSGGAGIWSPGGVVVDDSTSRVFVTTGNGNCPNAYDNYNDAVVRLSPSLGLEDYFAPEDWHDHWSCNDQDLGSAGTVLLSPTLGFQSGKWGSGFLYNPQSMGGVDGQLFPTPKPATYSEFNVCQGSVNDANFGSYAYAAPYVYLSCESNGLVALNVDTTAKTFSQQWNAGSGKVYGAPIVAGGIVWAVDTNGSGLTGFDANTGGTLFQSAAFGAHRFSTPAEAGGQVFVASDNVVRSFNLIKACTNAGLTAMPASPQTAGTPVTLTGSVSNCPTPLYRFWVQPPGGSWRIERDYNSTATFSWTTDTIAGLWHLEVDVKSTGSTAAYDSVANSPYTINSASACTSANLTTAPPSPGPTGGTVVMTGSSTGCPNPQYRFWVQDPGRRWSMVQDYSSVNTHSWAFHTTAGSYNMEVDVRDASETVAYDVVFNLTYVVQGCTAASLSASPASPHTAGVMVTITGSSTCGGTPTYRFWIQDPGRRWSMVQDFSTSNTYTWAATNNTVVGVYNLEVDVRNQGSTEVYEVVFNTTYTMS